MFKSLLLIFSFIILLVCAYAAFREVTEETIGPSTFSESYVNGQYWLEPDNTNVAQVNQKLTFKGEIMFLETKFDNNGNFTEWTLTYSYKDPNNVTLYNTVTLPNRSLQQGVIFMQNVGDELKYKEEIIPFNEFSELINKKDKTYAFQIDLVQSLTTDETYINYFTIQDAKD